MLDTQVTGDKETGTVIFRGELTYNNIELIKEAYLDAISRFNTVITRIKELSQIDFSFIQLAFSAQKSAEKQGKTLVLVPPDSRKFRDAIEHSGFTPYIQKVRDVTGGIVFKGAN
ncbi:MAG: hypothetical protein GY757_13690 [bacterium]|nr:hypothetical protein [bacterium]